jgi:hypothetical protein
MFKRQAYENVGGFPKNILLEDVAISFEMKKKGLTIFYAPHIICGEESPVNFVAHKKRCGKWARGDIGLVKRYFFKMCFSKKLKLHEKLDIIRAPFLTSCITLFIFLLVSAVVTSALLGVDLFIDKFVWIYLCTPILYPFLIYLYIFRFSKMFFKSFFEIILFICIGGASFVTLLFSSFLGFINKKLVYPVTPKDSEKITFRQAIKYNRLEIFLGLMLVAFIIFSLLSFNVFIVSFGMLIYLSVCMIISPLFCFMSNKTYTDKKSNRIDEMVMQSIYTKIGFCTERKMME